MEVCSYVNNKRILVIDGEDGSVACSVYGPMARTIPRLSDSKVIECATRTILRLRNLVAVRGSRGTAMVGPLSYFGNLEESHLYFYTINIHDGLPLISRFPKNIHYQQITKTLLPNIFRVTIPAIWTSGISNQSSLSRKSSLFPNPGILEIPKTKIILPSFNALLYDLSEFKAQVVLNSIPFSINNKKLSPADDFRLITYYYDVYYQERQLSDGPGLFLEHHKFSQTITPLFPDSTGFVTLGRYIAKNILQLIAVTIPYGCTLIIHPEAIHGDATLNGFFLMAMTSNHVTMRTADTVFLKDTLGGNVRLTTSKDNNIYPKKFTPIVLFDEDTNPIMLENESLIFNPLSKGYWKIISEQ